jgi:hypothetical protein
MKILLINENFVQIWPEIFWETGGRVTNQDSPLGAREARTAIVASSHIFAFFSEERVEQRFWNGTLLTSWIASI